MKRSAIAAPFGLAALALLAGCGHSPPTRFFTLDAVPATRPVTPTAYVAPVQLDAVHIPAALDRPEVVSQVGANELRVSDLDHWGAPLGEIMRRTLAQDLMARLPQGAFVLPDAPRPPGVRALVVDVLQLQADAGGRVYLQASWTLAGRTSTEPPVIQNVQLTADGAPGAAGQAAALSQLMGELADRIAATTTA